MSDKVSNVTLRKASYEAYQNVVFRGQECGSHTVEADGQTFEVNNSLHGQLIGGVQTDTIKVKK